MQFFLLVAVLMAPFWVFGSRPLPIPLKLPVSAFAAFTPMIAAALLACRKSGFSGVRALFRRAFDAGKIQNRLWYAPILLLNPLVFLLAYAGLRWTGAALSDPDIQVLMIPLLFAVFFIFAVGEELGWMGCAIDPLQARHGAVKAGLLLGLVWALIHLPADIQNQQAAGWIFWHRLGTVLLRVLMVWIYNNTGRSVFSAILFHATNNLSWALFPNFGSHYDPFSTCLLLGLATVGVLVAWDWQTLTRLRFGRRTAAN